MKIPFLPQAIIVSLMVTKQTSSFTTAPRGMTYVSDCSQKSSTSSIHSASSSDEVQRLLEQAKKIREELAVMQGRSYADVEKEAQIEKDEKRRREQLQVAAKEGGDASVTKFDEMKSSVNSRRNRIVQLPETAEDQTRQAALAIERAFQDGITRQTVRLALLKEDQYISSEEEEWPGGAQEMYREAGRPLTEALLSEIRAFPESLLSNESSKFDSSVQMQYPPKIKVQTIWDFDGSALVTAESAAGPDGDVQALVFANTDTKYIKDIQEICKAMGSERLFLLVNPFWRGIESWSFNLLAPNAKRLAQDIIFGSDGGGFEETYVLLRFSVRGEKCVALKAYPYDWQLFAYIEDQTFGYPVETAVRLGSSKDKPTTKQFTELLNGRPEFKLTRTMRQMKNMF